MESPVNQTNDARFAELVSALEMDDSEDTRAAIEAQFEEDVRYVGSSEIMYVFRSLTGEERGAPFQSIVRDVARSLKVDANLLGSDREVVERLAEGYATQQFADLPMMSSRNCWKISVSRKKGPRPSWPVRRNFCASHADRSVQPRCCSRSDQNDHLRDHCQNHRLPACRTSVRIPGGAYALVGILDRTRRLTLSLGWTAFDLQGSAKRKTIPIVLYLGLCSLRERHKTD